MKPDVYLYILVMAGVTYLIRVIPLALTKKGDHQSFYKIFSVLCAVCMSGGYDLSGNFVCHIKCDLRSCGLCSGSDRSL